jgi:hypothetical protein
MRVSWQARDLVSLPRNRALLGDGADLGEFLFGSDRRLPTSGEALASGVTPLLAFRSGDLRTPASKGSTLIP